MNHRFRNRDDRHIARIYRSTKCVILEMQVKTLAYRAILADYARREKSVKSCGNYVILSAGRKPVVEGSSHRISAQQHR